MNTELLSLLTGFFSFAIFWLLFMDEDTDPVIVKRLLDTKERKVGAKRNDESIFEQLDAENRRKQANLDELLRESSDYRLSYLEKIFKKFGITEKVKKMLKLADVKMPIDLFFMISGGAFIPFLLLAALKGSIFLLIPGFIASGMPFVVIKFKINKILKEFNGNFPDALGLISNALRAGHSLLSSFQMVATDSPYPINKLFKTLSDDVSLGRDVREALEDMSNSIPHSDDLRFFITAVLIQKEIGGNLAEILDSLNNTIRERNKLIGLIKTMTSQAQLSGIVLGLAPFFIAGIVSLLNAEYMSVLYSTMPGNISLLSAIMMSGLGFLVIKKITQIRV